MGDGPVLDTLFSLQFVSKHRWSLQPSDVLTSRGRRHSAATVDAS